MGIRSYSLYNIESRLICVSRMNYNVVKIKILCGFISYVLTSQLISEFKKSSALIISHHCLDNQASSKHRDRLLAERLLYKGFLSCESLIVDLSHGICFGSFMILPALSDVAIVTCGVSFNFCDRVWGVVVLAARRRLSKHHCRHWFLTGKQVDGVTAL